MTTYLRALIICITFIFAWQLIILIWHIPDYLLPSPLQVLSIFLKQYQILLLHTGYTILETFVGLMLGVLFGCVVGILIAFFQPFKTWFLPILIMSQAIPIFAIAPLLVVWLGYGFASKIVTATLMIFFPVASNLYDGLKEIEPGWLDLAQTMRGKKWRIFCHIRLPAALPALASGIRIAAVIAPIGAIIGEWVGASHGLGYLMLNANASLQIDLMFAALALIVLLSLALYFMVDKLLQISITW